jgi:hypothetical protein
MEEEEIIGRVIEAINTTPFIHEEFIRGKNSISRSFATQGEYIKLLRNCVQRNRNFSMEDVGYWYGRLTHPGNPDRWSLEKGI